MPKKTIKEKVKDTVQKSGPTKKLAIYQIALAIVIVVFASIGRILISNDTSTMSTSMWHLTFKSSWGILRIINLGFQLAVFVIGIFQIVQGSQKSDGLVIAAGITAIFIFISWLAFVVLILNIIIVAKKN